MKETAPSCCWNSGAFCFSKEWKFKMLILASGSPRRRELLHLITDEFAVHTSEVDERAISAPNARLLVQKLALEKAAAVQKDYPGDTIIGCDTVVELEGEVLGKPENPTQAAAMLRALSGKTHFVHTGVCILQQDSEELFCESSNVTFSPLSEAEIAAYIATSEPYDKAGGYGIQGGAAKFIRRIEGCYFNIMGLPVSALYQHLQRQNEKNDELSDK
ncbi:MAG: Maf family protein [Pygmaiobacter sp.]